MLLQPDMNSLLHNMRAQIQALTSQLAEIQAAPAAEPTFEWIKLQIWIKANWDVFADDFEIATAECYTAGVWPTWDDLKVEIKKYFKLQAERDWARQQICTFKQGNMRTDDFVTRFLALSIQGGLGNEHAVELLEPNVSPAIARQFYIQEMRSKNLAAAAEEVQKIGRAIELYDMQFSGRSTTKNDYPQRSPGSSNQKSNHSHGFQPGRGAPMDIGAVQGGQKRRFTCFSCGQEGHMAQDCTNRAWAAHQKNNQGRQVCQLEAEKPDDRLQTLASRSYNEIRAFFYDQQTAGMKTQGKEFGA
ncbi:hypothetical protein SERLA73DRAFT_79526 [Serpula lacrymans var. lacrymans S7.3]|uniref:CCHC-type domain-containing protein n=2 Tax=Serpula lacrymans var. lacrymans TaxID=341189 RepID=F8QGQ8_SERL3|nr:uncharacterized protein SERLADRAFT_433442 [Serpula lacrymans var. lacrymans S7.9]EGN92491.1 hypothetical protein SERLA73DRAFT_79526 [Serpula lacrymans var. lacrymans S7.3]EGO29463.1 hypothetical protein SERLADRAFT_433442 [Serpula lacrymans var. lacrymans S7.9]